MKVAIIYICTGDYSQFFHDFYFSSEKLFLIGQEKEYHIFTDRDDYIIGAFKQYSNIIVHHIEKFPWPLNTLLRFHYMDMIRSSLISCDYTFFFNANSLFVNEFDSRCLPGKEHGYLLGVKHPGYSNKIHFLHPHERRNKVSCRIPYSYRKDYLQGCFNGGRTQEFLRLIDKCKTLTDYDLKRNLIARVHDESYLNFYFFSERINVKILSENYSWPEKYGVNKNAIILMRDKEKCAWYKGIK
ncbi:hypothetical protein PHA77_05780 [Edwardsiella tarda]|uniref:family 6 glucosyltransferase n=1 Tax=Edwardsiella tarda TaxID=636 RepID=UPI0024450E70|nr:family 6 glucosyltransferase [Edwardsiella tarda]WGE30131.1 hypothetical protein PHA77_05780 [Edwardsiella tarda]